MLTLYAVRHGETDYNKEDRVQGSHDSRLTDFGRVQALALAEYFQKIALDDVYTSPLLRARETAEAVAAHHDLPIWIMEGLHELRCGEFEGLQYKEIMRTRRQEFIDWLQNPKVPAPGGESLDQLFSRVSSALDQIFVEADSDSNIALVCHAGVVRMALAVLVGVPVGVSTAFSLSNASISIFQRRRDRWTCHAWNYTCHLANLEGEVKSIL